MTTQPDALPKCPFCGDDVAFDADGSISITPLAGSAYCVNGICGCSGPRADNEHDAIAAFTNPAHALAASRAECERLRVALEEIIKAWDHKTGDYYVDNYLSDVEIDAARAALAAQGGGA